MILFLNCMVYPTKDTRAMSRRYGSTQVKVIMIVMINDNEMTGIKRRGEWDDGQDVEGVADGNREILARCCRCRPSSIEAMSTVDIIVVDLACCCFVASSRSSCRRGHRRCDTSSSKDRGRTDRRCICTLTYLILRWNSIDTSAPKDILAGRLTCVLSACSMHHDISA